MMEKLRFFRDNSLKTRLLLLFIILAATMGLLVGYNNLRAYTLLRKNIYKNTEDTLSFYQRSVDELLKRNESFLYTTSVNDLDLTAIKYYEKNTTTWFSALYRLNNSLKNALAVYTMDDVFCYIPEQNTYLSGAGTSLKSSYSLCKFIQSQIDQDIWGFSSWNVFRYKDKYYFLRLVYFDDAYVGGLICMNTLLDSLNSNDGFNKRLYFSDEEGELLYDGTLSPQISLPERSGDYFYRKDKDGTRILSVSKYIDVLQLHLSSLVPESEFTNSSSEMLQIIVIVAMGILLIWGAAASAIKIWILKPIFSLTDAIRQLRDGNLKAKVSSEGQLKEFSELTTAFNEMASEIEELKIDVYEKKIQQQKLEAQYLKQQITPHFMINCLNTAYQLTEMDRADLARKMLKDLSRHLRFILSSGQTVLLREELALVDNYIELSEIRYPYSIRYTCSCPDELKNVKVIPLMLVNFIENTVKYEVRMGTVLETYVDISMEKTDEYTILLVCIWDTGDGFSDEMLKHLSDIDSYVKNEEKHIGIVNVIMRARQIYDRPEFRFSNRPGAGAQIDMRLPMKNV